jgi:hypothetical protein
MFVINNLFLTVFNQMRMEKYVIKFFGFSKQKIKNVSFFKKLCCSTGHISKGVFKFPVLKLVKFGFVLDFPKKYKLKTRKLRKSKRLLFKKYLETKTVVFKSKQQNPFGFNNKRSIKIPFILNGLNFTKVTVISGLRDNMMNPFFGGIKKGTFKGFFQVGGVKEYINQFLLPRWYRLQRFNFYKRYWKQKENNLYFFKNYRVCFNFFQNIMNRRTFVVFCHFYIRKRWDLLHFFK